MEEIVVTATLRDEQISDVPISVTAFSADTIAEREAQHFEQLLNMAPNVNYASGASRGRFVQVRGIGERSQFKDPLDSSVGLIVDGVDFSGVGLSGTLFDVRQMEVLRGPQGTAYGSNAMGGLLFIESNDPTPERSGSLMAGAGSYGAWQTGAVLNGPLSEKVSGRLAIHQFRGDGYIRNDFLTVDDTNGFDELTLRGKLRWEPSAESRIDLTALYLDADNGYDAFSLQHNRHTGSDEPGHDAQQSFALSLSGVHEWRNRLQLEASIFWEDSDLEYGFDWDWSDFGTSSIRGHENNRRARDSLGIDIRLTSGAETRIAGTADWVAGVYLYRRDVSLRYNDLWEEIGWVGPSSFASDFETDRAAVYGQLDWALSDRLLLTLGGRLERYDDSYNDSASVSASPDDDLWGGRASLQFLVSDETMLYASVSRGYKTGGVNGQAAAGADPAADPDVAQFLLDRLAFETETLTNYEAGIRYARGSTFDFSLTAFHMRRDDMQAKAWILFPPANWKSYKDNVDDGENQGIELSAFWGPTDRLAINAGMGLLDTELGDLTIRDVDTGLSVNQQGRDQAQAPNYQYFVSATYDMTANLSANVQLDGKDAYHFSNAHDVDSVRYGIVHMTLGYTRENLEISLWGRNLTDEDTEVRGFYFGNNPLNGWQTEAYTQLGEPFTWGVTIRTDF